MPVWQCPQVPRAVFKAGAHLISFHAPSHTYLHSVPNHTVLHYCTVLYYPYHTYIRTALYPYSCTCTALSGGRCGHLADPLRGGLRHASALHTSKSLHLDDYKINETLAVLSQTVPIAPGRLNDLLRNSGMGSPREWEHHDDKAELSRCWRTRRRHQRQPLSSETSS